MKLIRTNLSTGRKYINWNFYVFGYPVRISLNNHYGVEDRSVLTIGFENESGHWSLLLQKYREGSRLERHTDLVGSNKCFWFLIKRASVGGDLIVDGASRSFFRNRVKIFDGGTSPHEVTTIERGSRVSLILQHGVMK